MKASGASTSGQFSFTGIRWAALALVCAGALVFAGCGGTDDKGTTTSAASTPETTTSEATTAPAGGGAPSGPAEEKVDVDIKDFAFVAPAITVKAGGSVTWTNSDAANHTATQSPQGNGFDTGTLEEGDTKTVKFDTPGTFQYICLFHAFMTGTVTVK